MLKTKIVVALSVMVCAMAATTTSAFANYRLEKVVKISNGEGNEFSATGIKIVCTTVVWGLKTTAEKAEELQARVKYEGCTAKILGGAAVAVEVTFRSNEKEGKKVQEESGQIRFTRGTPVKEAKEQWEIRAILKNEFKIKILSSKECLIRVPRGTNLQKVFWRNVKHVEKPFQSEIKAQAAQFKTIVRNEGCPLLKKGTELTARYKEIVKGRGVTHN